MTAYRTCNAGLRKAAPLGSTFHREIEFISNQARDNQQPYSKITAVQMFFNDVTMQIHELQDADHAILLVLNANATLVNDNKFQTMADQFRLIDLPRSDPSMSTYNRIYYIG